MSASGAEAEGQSGGSTQTIAGFLAAFSIAASLISIAWHPLRLIGPAIIVAFIAAGLGGRHNRLALAAVMIAAASFFLGMTVAVVTQHAIW